MAKLITGIKIKNFRQYKDINLSLKSSNRGNLDVIIGNNRYGKTNFLNSILWCLYGKDGLPSEGSESFMHYVKNERYSQEETSVEISLEDNENGEIMVITRTDNSFSVLKKDSSKNKFVPLGELEGKREIRTLLPKSIKNFFLFKGEFLDTFFEENGNSILKETIKEVSKIKLLEKISSVLENLELEYMKKIERQNKSNENIKKIGDKIERIDISIKQTKKKIEEISLNVKNYEKQIDEIDNSLKNMNKERINQLIERETELKDQKEKSIQRINKIKLNIMESFLKDSSKWMIYLAMADFKSYMEKLRYQELIPPPIKPELVKKILKEEKCICGQCVNKEMKNILTKFLEKFPKDNRLEILYELNMSFDLDNSKFERDYEGIKKLIEEESEEERIYKEISQKLSDVNSELIGMDKESISKLAIKREFLQKKLEESKNERDMERSNLRSHEEYKSEKMSAYQLESSKLTGSKELSEKMAVCSKIKEKLQNLSKDVLENISNELNKKTIDNFKNIFWENYQHINYNIKVDENFDVSVISPKGNNLINRLSTGEKKVLALSFIISLSDFYGFGFPIIIDAPFTALQKEVTTKMLETLLKLSKEKQLIILTIPHEKEIMKELSNSSNSLNEMRKDDQDNTKIVVAKND